MPQVLATHTNHHESHVRSHDTIRLPREVLVAPTRKNLDHIIDDCTLDTVESQKQKRTMTATNTTSTDVDIPRLHPKPRRTSVSSKLSTDTTGIMMEEYGDDHTSGTVVSTTTIITTASTNSSNPSCTSTTPLPVTDKTMPQPSPRARTTIIPSTRRLVVHPKDVWYIRSQEIQTIVQWYQKQQQQRLSTTNTISIIEDKNDSVIGDDFIPHPCAGTTVTTRSMTRDCSSYAPSFMTSHDRTAISSLSCSTSPTFLIVTGPTGAGKTKLLQEALQERVGKLEHRNSNSGYYIRGTFDVLQHPDPYRAFILALTDFTTQVLVRSRETSNIVVPLRQAILNACGDDIQVLIQMIPLLSAVLMNDQIKIPEETINSAEQFVSVRSLSTTTTAIDTKQQGDATQRFVFVFQKFLRAISSVVPSIVLVLEDMQYADDCSIDVLCSILTDLHQIPGLFVAATYNGTDLMDNSASVEQRVECTSNQSIATSAATATKTSYFVEHVRKIERCRQYDGSIQVHTMAIENLNDEQVHYLLRQTLKQCTDSNLLVDRSFHSLVMKHTSGNLYRIIEFLNWLEVHQLLTTKSRAIGNNTFDHWTWYIDES
jgi:Cdc6-like AAA superfamily ATPase